MVEGTSNHHDPLRGSLLRPAIFGGVGVVGIGGHVPFRFPWFITVLVRIVG